MDIARYIDNGKNSIIVKAEVMTPKLYNKIYRGNLYCEYKNCNAEIIFNERQKGKFTRYFSTKPGSPHRPGCPNEIIHRGSKGPKIKIKGTDINVCKTHINYVLDDAYKSFYNKLHHSKIQKIHKNKLQKKSKLIKTTDANKEPIFTLISMPTTNGEGETLIKGKEPYIYKRDISEITNEDMHTYKEVHGIVYNIRYYENEVYIDLKDLNNIEFSVYIGLPFKTSFEQEFKLLNYIKTYIKQQNEINEPIICTSVGEIMLLNNKSVIQVYNYNHIKLDNLNIYEIVDKLNKQICMHI